MHPQFTVGEHGNNRNLAGLKGHYIWPSDFHKSIQKKEKKFLKTYYISEQMSCFLLWLQELNNVTFIT